MHNSGTSLVGALLHAAGVPMGDRLLLRDNIEAARRPRYDYFEDQDVVALQDEHLLRMQRHWSSYRASFGLPDRDGTERLAFRHALADLVSQRLRRQGLWVVKDPRTATLLDDWLAVLAEQGITAKLLIVHRDAASNIRSFSRKGQVPPLWAEALWQRTYANAVEAVQTLAPDQVHLVSFENLLSAPVEQAHQACGFLGWKPPRELEQRIQARFDPSLPTESGTERVGVELHAATSRLQRCLSSAAAMDTAPAEAELLAAQMYASVANPDAPLQLNGLHPHGQTLQPKLRITIVTAELQGWSAGGGIGSAYLELALALAAAGHPVRVLLVQAGVRPAADAPERLVVEPVDPTGLSRLELCRRIAERVRADPGDVIHLHDWLGLGSGLKETLGPEGPPVIVGLHGPSAWTRSRNRWPSTADGGLAVSAQSLYAEGLMQALEEDLILHAGLLVSPSSFMASWVKDHLLGGGDSPELVVQRNCTLSGQRLQATSEARPPSQRPLIYFGRLEERKGLLLFLDAVKRLPSKPAEVVFLGGDCLIQEGRNGSELAQEQLNALQLPHRFLSALQRADALAQLQELQGVVAIPSLIENSPCVVEEVLDSGLQVVTTNVGGTRELVASESETWLSEPEPEAFAFHLHRALTYPATEEYRLKARLAGWQIALSWQAFHERLPRPQRIERPSAAPASLMQRGLGYSKRIARAALRRVLQAGC